MGTFQPEKWVNEYGDYLYNYAFIRINHAETARDMVQEVFIAALKAKEHFKGENSEKTLLTTILKRKIIDYYRSKGKATIHLLNDSIPFKDQGIKRGYWRKAQAPGEWDKNTAELPENEALGDALQRCMNHLPYQWRACFMLKKIENENTENVCKELEITASHLWVILHRTRLKLRQCLEKLWFKQ